MPYKDINQVMPWLYRQIRESIPYCKKHFTGFNSPDELFRYLKSMTRFKYDPDDMELLQTAETLFENNWHGQPGLGDCDCFTILAVACLWVNNFTPYIILAGNGKRQPSHIYAGVLGANNRVDSFDLTEPFFGSRREYKYYQLLPVN